MATSLENNKENARKEARESVGAKIAQTAADLGQLQVSKGVLTIGELVGSWPGNETDEEIAEVLALLRGPIRTENAKKSDMLIAKEL